MPNDVRLLTSEEMEWGDSIYSDPSVTRNDALSKIAERFSVSPNTVRRGAAVNNWRRPGSPSPIRQELVSDTVDINHLWELIESLQDEMNKLSDHKAEASVQIDTDKPIAVVFMSDVHIGGVGTDHRQLRKDVELISETDGAYVYWGGDSLDNFVLGGKMLSASREQVAQVQLQWVLFEDILLRLADKIVAIGTGNHEAWTEALTGLDGVAQIAHKLNLLYTKHGGMLNLTVGDQIYRIFRRHRFPGQNSSNLTASIKAMYDKGPSTFDVGVQEDLHQPALEHFIRHPQERDGRKVWALRPGTYKVNDAYAHSQGYYHGGMGNPTLIFHPKEWRIDAHPDMTAALEMLTLLRKRNEANM